MTEEVLRPRWRQLSVAGQRDVVGALMERIEVGRAGRLVTRWTTVEERLEIASDRVKVTWRR